MLKSCRKNAEGSCTWLDRRANKCVVLARTRLPAGESEDAERQRGKGDDGDYIVVAESQCGCQDSTEMKLWWRAKLC